jgi:hypothetical protein
VEVEEVHGELVVEVVAQSIVVPHGLHMLVLLLDHLCCLLLLVALHS